MNAQPVHRLPTFCLIGILIIVGCVGFMAYKALAHTHCGTPQAEADCPTTTVASTTTTTTVPKRACDFDNGRSPVAVPVTKPCPTGTHDQPPSGPPTVQPPYVPPAYSCGPTQAPSPTPCATTVTLAPPLSISPEPTTAPPSDSVPSAPVAAHPVPRQTAAPVSTPKALPVTGAASTDAALAGGLFVLGGLVCIFLSRRRLSR